MSLEQILHMHETLNLLTKFIEFCWVFSSVVFSVNLESGSLGTLMRDSLKCQD